MRSATAAISLLQLVSAVSAATSWIVPGTAWYDTSGAKIDAHGGMVFQRESTFYWLGWNSENISPALYTSTDLLNWENLGLLDSSVTELWRPKYAKPNGSFWIYGQQDREVLALRSASLSSGYAEYEKVLLPPDDYSYSDTGMFQDPDTDTWYILTSADHNTVQINEINANGSVGDRVTTFTGGAYEAPGMFKVDGVYYLIVSSKTGWRANPNKVFWATELGGSWSGGTDIAPEDENTYGSQNTFELVIEGSEVTTYVYMGDSWDSSGGASSNYTWLPMTVDTSAHTVTLEYYSMWKIDPSTGVVLTSTTKRRWEAEDAVLSGRAAVTTCNHCISKRSVHEIDPGSHVTFYNVTGSGLEEWYTFHYEVNDREAGEAYIQVNGDGSQVRLCDLNSRAGRHRSVPVRLRLEEGDMNTIKFGVTGSKDFVAVLDGIEIYED